MLMLLCNLDVNVKLPTSLRFEANNKGAVFDSLLYNITKEIGVRLIRI